MINNAIVIIDNEIQFGNMSGDTFTKSDLANITSNDDVMELTTKLLKVVGNEYITGTLVALGTITGRLIGKSDTALQLDNSKISTSTDSSGNLIITNKVTEASVKINGNIFDTPQSSLVFKKSLNLITGKLYSNNDFQFYKNNSLVVSIGTSIQFYENISAPGRSLDIKTITAETITANLKGTSTNSINVSNGTNTIKRNNDAWELRNKNGALIIGNTEDNCTLFTSSNSFVFNKSLRTNEVGSEQGDFHINRNNVKYISLTDEQVDISKKVTMKKDLIGTTDSEINGFGKIYNATWNDIADYIDVDDDCLITPGKVYSYDDKKKTYTYSAKYKDKSAIGIASDTFGFVLGQRKEKKQIPIAIGGFVLAYTPNKYTTGTPLVATKNGDLIKANIITRIFSPERILATYFRKEMNEEWNGITVNNRHWVKIK